MKLGSLDCAVTVCDEAGTVISWNPSLVQGLGQSKDFSNIRKVNKACRGESWFGFRPK